ncbi:MAG: helix-turn-helix domain-containing protein, partial [Weissella cibaria]
MEWIWTTQEQNRISVFRYMVRNRFTRLTDLMAEFQFSRYMVISIIEQLNEDIAVLTGETDILVIEKGNVIIFDAPLNVLPVDELKHYYLSQSTRAQIIMHLVAEDFDSWEELAFELDVSTPTVYKERAIVIEHLAEQDITLNKNNQLVGQEENIRFLRFALLTIYNGQRTEEISDRVKQVADYYIDSFITPEFGDLRESQRCIIWHMAAIWTVRFTQRHFVTATYTDQYLVPTSEMSPQSQRVIQAVKQLMGRSGLLSDEDLDNEARFIVLILHSLGVFATTQTHQDVTAHVIQWWQDFDASIQGSY